MMDGKVRDRENYLGGGNPNTKNIVMILKVNSPKSTSVLHVVDESVIYLYFLACLLAPVFFVINFFFFHKLVACI